LKVQGSISEEGARQTPLIGIRGLLRVEKNMNAECLEYAADEN